jgi:hypothetical protein
MKTQELRNLIREEVRKVLNEADVAKTGNYEIRHITDDIGTKIYSVFLDGLQVGDSYDGEGGILTNNKKTSEENIKKLLGLNR